MGMLEIVALSRLSVAAFTVSHAPHPNPLPAAGERGRGPQTPLRETQRVQHVSFSPRAGRRWRQPDEGQMVNLERAGSIY